MRIGCQLLNLGLGHADGTFYPRMSILRTLIHNRDYHSIPTNIMENILQCQRLYQPAIDTTSNVRLPCRI
jgi:hypothetical protein